MSCALAFAYVCGLLLRATDLPIVLTAVRHVHDVKVDEPHTESLERLQSLYFNILLSCESFIRICTVHTHTALNAGYFETCFRLVKQANDKR